MKMSEQIHELSTALSIAQGEMRNAEKNGKGNFGKYSNLESVWDVARECLPPQGLSVVQDVTSADKGINVETTLMHKSGQWMTFGPLFIPANAFTAHAFASACSYGKRYSLCACRVVDYEALRVRHITPDTAKRTARLAQREC